MRTIMTQRKVIPWLLRELKKSTPQVHVPPGFLIVVAGVCEGLMWNAGGDLPPDLKAVVARTDVDLTCCGMKLIDFARVLANAGALEPSGAWSKAALIRLMVESLGADWLVIRSRKGKPPLLWSTWESPQSTRRSASISSGRPAKSDTTRLSSQVSPRWPSAPRKGGG